MINWKNLKQNPPAEDCSICLKYGVSYDTFEFKRYSADGWELTKFGKRIDTKNIDNNALYINLDEIMQ